MVSQLSPPPEAARYDSCDSFRYLDATVASPVQQQNQLFGGILRQSRQLRARIVLMGCGARRLPDAASTAPGLESVLMCP